MRCRILLALLPLAPLAAQTASAPITIPSGTRLELLLPQQTRLHGVGEVVALKLAQPVYTGDRLALPAGSTVLGTIIGVQGPKLLPRIEDGMGGDFSPAPTVQLRFDALVLAGGERIPIVTRPAPERPALHMVTAGGARGGAAQNFERQISQMYHQREDAFESLLREQTHWQSVKQEAFDSLPWRPAAMPAGASFAAVLTEAAVLPDAPPAPPPSPDAGAALALPEGLEIHARLDQNLSSATAHWGESVSATLDRPALDAQGRVVIPQGARLTGTVAEVHPARWFGRGGRLRFTFDHLVLPAAGAPPRPVSAALTAAAVRGGVEMGSEGGAKAAPPGGAAPYVALSVVMAATLKGDSDNAWSLNAGSGTHLQLWGTALAMVSHAWQPIGLGLGFAGAGRTIYGRWIGRGPQMVFPKDTALEIHISPPGKHGTPLGR